MRSHHTGPQAETRGASGGDTPVVTRIKHERFQHEWSSSQGQEPPPPPPPPPPSPPPTPRGLKSPRRQALEPCSYKRWVIMTESCAQQQGPPPRLPLVSRKRSWEDVVSGAVRKSANATYWKQQQQQQRVMKAVSGWEGGPSLSQGWR